LLSDQHAARVIAHDLAHLITAHSEKDGQSVYGLPPSEGRRQGDIGSCNNSSVILA
jgi:hypothetical protein